MNRLVTAWAVALLLAASSCDCRAGRTEDPGYAWAKLPVQVPAGFEELMQDHAKLGDGARDALVRGDLPVATQAMKKLSFFMEHVPYPPLGENEVAVARTRAREAGEATDLDAAALALGQLGYACGQCHQAADRGPAVSLEPAPGGPGVTLHMQRHAWAMERMWESLLGGSRVAFSGAAAALMGAPLHGTGELEQEDPPGVAGLETRVHTLAASAVIGSESGKDGPSMAEQGEVYGRLLGTCARCHGLLDVELPGP